MNAKKSRFSRMRKSVSKGVKSIGSAIKNRYKDKKGYKWGTIAKDASTAYKIARTVAPYLPFNAEKKRFTFNSGNIPRYLGQLNTYSSADHGGYYFIELTPHVAQGDTISTRGGNSIKMTSMYMSFQFWHLSACINKIRVKWYIVQNRGPAQSNQTTFEGPGISGSPINPIQTDIENLFNPSQFATSATPRIIDFMNPFNPDYYGQLKVIRKGQFSVQGDSISGQSNPTDVIIKHKWRKGHHVRYASDGSSNITKGDFYLIMIADCGNIGTTVSGLGGIPVTAVNTGLQFNANITGYYYDN